MNVVIRPNLDGVASERLHTFAQQLAILKGEDDDVRQLVNREASWAKRSHLLNGQTHAYEAAVRLLADLRLLKWHVRADAYSIELESPTNPKLVARSADSIREAKDAVRKELSAAIASQFAEPTVRKFIQGLESPASSSRRKSIRLLIASGDEVYARLRPALGATDDARSTRLASAIQPYLQLVPGENEPPVLDEFTEIPLGDVWRYFRYTWSLPHTPIPGRQMLYLVRDRAHPYHAVIGLAALSNSPLLSPERDKRIGWTTDIFCERMAQAAKASNRAELANRIDYLRMLLAQALEGIDPTGLACSQELSEPDEDVIARLQRRANEFSNRREEALRDVADAANAKVPLTLQETEQSDYGVPEVSLAMLELEGKRAPANSKETLARRLLVAKKRAFELSRLLRARLVLQRQAALLIDPEQIMGLLQNDDFRAAVGTILLSAKSNNVGTSILEVTTCGAVEPYNHLLGGKLVALLLLSPEVADDYRRRYSDQPAIISSQLKNAERRKDCTLAWLNTTSLYSLGSSQYERLRLPVGTISPDQPELRYEHIGDTEGYGTVQFSEATVQAVQNALYEFHQYRDVNSIFGEGFSPKFRKMRDGMDLLGFNSTVLMRHDQKRRMYAVPLWGGADAFLRQETDETPDYVRTPGQFRDATERIAAFWRRRWLASRLNHAPTLQVLRECESWLLSDRIAHLPVNAHSVKSRPRKLRIAETAKVAAYVVGAPSDSTSAPDKHTATPSISFWQELAQAGPEACADEIPFERLDRLHVPHPLDDFLLRQVRAGFSLVLTGNAGDGKTHLLRRLAPELHKLGAEVETDATAAMRPNDIAPILKRWRKAAREGRPFCLAANEYPLYLLRRDGTGFAPIDEVDRQCQHRLAYALEKQPDEAAREKVLVVDLSLRNPLAAGFAGPLLDRLLAQSELQDAAKAEIDGDLAWNLHHLSHATVHERLLHLLGLLAAAGKRATVRELWIWAARLLLGKGDDDNKPVRSPGRWYSNRMFEPDDRFALIKSLQRLADPAAHSHPRWDLRLESGRVTEGWLIDGTPKMYGVDDKNFGALKRRFYFEHARGPEVLGLDGAPGQALLNVLHAPQPPESGFKHFLIETINRAYCPEIFPQMSTQLYLWIGHRFHEQPSHGYVANQSVSDGDLSLLRPRLPARLTGAFDYQPDHLLLEYHPRMGEPAQLRVDYALFVALEKLRQGLPRQLLPDRELNRLDAFLEQLRRADVPKTREFFVHNQDERTTAQITLSSDLSMYEAVKIP
jgi:hypothetical protein